jgi:hypothetical protein
VSGDGVASGVCAAAVDPPKEIASQISKAVALPDRGFFIVQCSDCTAQGFSSNGKLLSKHGKSSSAALCSLFTLNIHSESA